MTSHLRSHFFNVLKLNYNFVTFKPFYSKLTFTAPALMSMSILLFESVPD